MKLELELQQNKKYKAVLDLGWKSWAPNSTVLSELSKAGFKDIHVTGEGATRTATGTWPGKTQTVTLPPEVKTVERI